MRRLVVTVIALVCVTLSAPGASASSRPKMRLSSPAFDPGGEIPDGFTCSGANASPPLRWKGVPKKPEELALVVLDPDAPIGTVVHWLAWGIDPKTGGLPEETLPADVVQGRNQAGRPAYLGPCPPPGDDPHHYKFTLYALSKPLALSEGASLDELRDAMRDAVLARARLVGIYARPVQDIA